MASSGIEYTVSLNDKATSQWKSLTNEINSGSAKIAQTVSGNLLGLGVTIAAIGYSVQKAFDWAEAGAMIEQNRAILTQKIQAMGLDFEKTFGDIRKASGGLIDEDAIIRATNRAVTLGIPIQNISELMLIARQQARGMGITVAEAFDKITEGVGRGAVRMLKGVGITLDLKAATNSWADAMGLATGEVDSQDKKLAILQQIHEKYGKTVNEATLALQTNYEKTQALHAKFGELKDDLQILIERFSVGLYDAIERAAIASADFAGKILIQTGVLQNARPIHQDFVDAVAEMKKEFDNGTLACHGLTAAVEENIPSLDSLRQSLSDANTALAGSAIGSAEYKKNLINVANATKHLQVAQAAYERDLKVFLGTTTLTTTGVIAMSGAFDDLHASVAQLAAQPLKLMDIDVSVFTKNSDAAFAAWDARTLADFQKTFAQVTELGQQAFGLIDQAMSQSSQAEISRLQSQYQKESTMLDKQKANELKAIETKKTMAIRAIELRLKSEVLSTEQRKALELEKFNLENRLSNERNAVEEKYTRAKEARDEVYNRKVSEAKRREFEQHKAFAIIESIINTAQAITKSLPNIPLAVAVGIMGAVETAIIASQEAPSFAQGGSFTVPSGFDNDSFPMRVQSGERVTVQTPEQQAINGGHSFHFNFYGAVTSEDGVKDLVQNGMRKLGIIDVGDYFRNTRTKLILSA